ncbi:MULTISPECIES: hypothetical protein [Methylobacterium]|uniref:hypothetical protein n=1 Tax=Methylobacterium TaxID=407 RepID=UPI0010482D49|nr:MULTISPECIES: hypothetical protein [Methylobacterium]MDR7038728.1 hypothetical protein [Methylobacterium sp. BE186]
MSLPSRSLPSRACAVALVAAGLGGCQALGGGGGVMPATDLGPPPSMRSSLPSRELRTANVDDEGAPLQTAPTRRLDLPKNGRTDTRAADAGQRRIRRDEIEGASEGGATSGGMAPAMSASGGVGLGGRF